MNTPVARLLVLSVLLAGFVALSGCNEDCGCPTEEDLALTGRVLDTDGAPVAGAAVGVAYDVMLQDPFLEFGTGSDRPLPPQPVFQLRQNYPNSFFPSTVIRYTVPQAVRVDLTILDRDSLVVRSLLAGFEALPGEHVVQWNGLDDADERVPSDVYLLRLECRDPTSSDLLYREVVGGVLLVDIDLAFFAPLTTTDAEGRFRIPFARLPMDEVIPCRDENGDDVGDHTVPTRVLVMARSDDLTAGVAQELGDMTREVHMILTVLAPLP